MSTVLVQNQQGSQAGQAQTITTTGGTETVSSTIFTALYRYQLGTGALLGYPLQFVATLTGASNGNTFTIITISDPDLVSAIVSDGALPLTNIPSAFTHVVQGTAPYVTLATKTFTTDGTYTFDLDLDQLTPILGSATNPTGGWNGSLLLWVYSTAAFASVSAPSLTAGVVLVRANRDTGRSQAPKGSRMDRCPVTGRMVSRQEMILDGYRGIYVHPSAWDPVEPEPLVWGEYPDPNEGGGS